MVEDTASVAALYKSYLNPLDVEVETVSTGQEALASVDRKLPQLILLDLRLPDMSGMDVLAQVRKHNANVPVIIMTAHGSIDVAVEAMRRGAMDFLIKPCEADQLRITVNKALKPAEEQPPNNNGREGHYHGFIGKSLPMQAVYRVIESAAPSKATVFITGESGTGKEVCAEAVHAASPRSNAPFIAINCAAIPKDLIESELFGHVKGAFTGASSDRAGAVELADGGTLFLDEICEMDLDLQSKLLRFIQTGAYQKVGSSHSQKVDVRFICATNRDPWEEVKSGNFREDLYYRLHVIPLYLPPLRERGEDVLDIAHSLLALMSVEEGRNFSQFDSEVLTRFAAYSWPGNIRQLQNIIRNIVVLNAGEKVTVDMLPPPLAENSGVNFASNFEIAELAAAANPLKETVTDGMNGARLARKSDIEPLWLTEKKAIQAAIDVCDGNIPQAAGLLEVSPSTIYRKLQSWQNATKG